MDNFGEKFGIYFSRLRSNGSLLPASHYLFPPGLCGIWQQADELTFTCIGLSPVQIRDPSGLQSGMKFLPSKVSCVRLTPFTLFLKICPALLKAIHFRSGDQTGSKSIRRKSVSSQNEGGSSPMGLLSLLHEVIKNEDSKTAVKYKASFIKTLLFCLK